MESTAYDSQLYSSNEANDWENPFDTFVDFSAYEAQSKSGGGQDGSLNISSFSSHDASASTCLQGFKDNDGFDMMCFCLRCQDSFIAQEIHGDSSRSKSLDAALSLQSSPPSGEVTTDTSVSPPSSCSSSPSRRSSKRQRHSSKSSGISKPATNTAKVRPEVLIDQLEVALHGDENSSAEFKFKSSILFNELKRLIEDEASSQRLSSVSDARPVKAPPTTTPSCHRKRGKLPKRNTSKTQSSGKIFHCTWPACQYASSSAMDWKRHEETHWPQKRYMCLECTSSAPDSSKCPYCLYFYPLHTQSDPSEHLLHCESAKRNGRTFARKDKLSEHLQKDHSIPPSSAMSRAANCVFGIDSGWTRQCGFCGILLDTWDERARHLAEDHFKQGADLGTWQPVFPDAWKFSAGHGCDTKNFDLEFCGEPLSQESYSPGPELSAALSAQFAGWEYSRPNPIPTVGIPPLSQPPQGMSELAGSSMYEDPEIVKRQLVQPTELVPTFDPTIEESTTQELLVKERPTIESMQMSERNEASPVNLHLTKEPARVRPSRMPQVGRIPKFISARPETTSPKAFPRPFSAEEAGPTIPGGINAKETLFRRRRKLIESETNRASGGRGRPDYFSPTASAGSFTEPHNSVEASSGVHRGVPVNPQSPEDITIPVELSSEDLRSSSNIITPGTFEYVKATGTTEDPIDRGTYTLQNRPQSSASTIMSIPCPKGPGPRDVDMSPINSRLALEPQRQPLLSAESGLEQASSTRKTVEDSHIRRVLNTYEGGHAAEAQQEEWINRMKHHPYFYRRRELIDEGHSEIIVDMSEEMRGLRQMMFDDHWDEEFSSKPWKRFSPAEAERLKQKFEEHESQAAELEQLKGRPGEHPYWPRRRQLIYELKGLDTPERIERIVDRIQEIRDLRRMKDNGDWGEGYSAGSRAYFSAEELERLKKMLIERKGHAMQSSLSTSLSDSASASGKLGQEREDIPDLIRANDEFLARRRHARVGNSILNLIWPIRERRDEEVTELERRRGVVTLEAIDGDPLDPALGKTLTNVPRLCRFMLSQIWTNGTTKAEGEATAVEAAVATEDISLPFTASSGPTQASEEGLGWEPRITMLKEAMVAQKSAPQPRKDQDLVHLQHMSYKDERATPQPKASFKARLQKLTLPFRLDGTTVQERQLSDQNRDSLSSTQTENIQARRGFKVDYEAGLSSAMAGMSIAEGSSIATKEAGNVSDGGVDKKSRLESLPASTTPIVPSIISAPAIEWEDHPRNQISMSQASG
ncbi:hypothetical protein BDZ45DRAFT_196697 [Acephala macrosclerotiorum]|nr:hypothetical protein BDZ45DRAFT_196697 [Acephala macrosclerotiorum]